MLQQVMTNPGRIEFREVDISQMGKRDVLIKIMRIGICGSDIHVYHGKHPFTGYPVTQGHEVSGEVVQVGHEVTGFHPGEKVTIEPQVYCGHCYPCIHGKYNLCENLKVMGFQTTGAASEYFVADESKVTKLPDQMTYDQGAMIEPLAVTVHAAKRFPDMKGAKVAILGAGPIGILLVQACKAMGASEVLITDVSDYRLSIAASVGADCTVNVTRDDLDEVFLGRFGEDRADVIYDCAGNNTTMNWAIHHARKGSMIILLAVFSGMATVDLAVLNDHELDLNTTMMYRHEDYVDAISFVEAGKVRLEPLMSGHFDFKDYQKAYQYIDENRESAMKILIDVHK